MNAYDDEDEVADNTFDFELIDDEIDEVVDTIDVMLHIIDDDEVDELVDDVDVNEQ